VSFFNLPKIQLPGPTYCSSESSHTQTLDNLQLSSPDLESDYQGSSDSPTFPTWTQEHLDISDNVNMYPGNFNLYKEPAQFSVASTDPDSDLDYSQWIHPGPVLDHHEAYEHFPMVDGQDPYSHAAGHSSYQGHRNWSMPGDTWTEAINEEHYILRSQEPFMELKDVGSYAEINDVSSNVPRLIPEAQPYFQGYMSDNVNMQPGPSQTAGFVSNEMDFVPMQASYGYEDRLAQDARVLYQDQTQQDCQDHTPGYYLQDPYYQGQTHGYPESAAQDQALFRKTHHVLSSPCLDDVGSSRARAVGAEHTANASSRAYRSNTGPRLMPKEDRILSQHASSHANHHTMAPLESFDGHRRRDSVQTSHSSSSSKPEGGQRTDPLYKAQPHPIDKLYHCPFRGRVQCKHDPTNLKCNYEYVHY